MPLDFQFKEPPLPLEFRKAIRGMVWIFSGIAKWDISMGIHGELQEPEFELSR